MAAERVFVVEHHPHDQTQPVTKRRYAYLDTALPKCFQRAMTRGKVYDVFEIYHIHTGRQVATLKIKLNGQIDPWFLWEQDFVPSPTAR